MRGHRGVRLLIGLVLVAGIGLAGYKAGIPLYTDLTAARSLQSLLAEGRRLVPVRWSATLRGDAKQDYHCFSDGQCFYAIDRFRQLYPAYNDLGDDVLVAEIRSKQGRP